MPVSTAARLEKAPAKARAGDLIRLADGIYVGRFRAVASGTATRRVPLCGSRRAVLDGGSISGGEMLTLRASYRTVEGITVRNGLLGVAVEGGSHDVLRDLEVHTTGQEAIHVRKLSSRNVVEHGWVHDAGLRAAKYGEGVYIGSARSAWGGTSDGQADRSDGNIVRNSRFGPNIRAESVDIKVAVRGNGAVVNGNTGAISPCYWVKVEQAVPGWGNGNMFRRNAFDLNGGTGVDGTGEGFHISPLTTGNVVYSDNRVRGALGGVSNVRLTP